MTLSWRPRPTALPPAGALARGPVREALLTRLRALPDEALAALVGVGNDEAIVVLGDVPWVDGLVWLGTDPAAPGLWLPTARTPDAPLALVAAAVARQTPLPAALADDLLVPLGGARPLQRERLR